MNLRSKGLTLIEVADYTEVTTRTVINIEQNYELGGLDKALKDDPRPGAPIRLGDRIKSYIVATVCSDPPEGFDRWTLELIRENVEEKGVVDRISLESIRMILQEHDLKPWRQQSWCIPTLDEDFIAAMEDVLKVYQRPYNPSKPVVCLDEKPIQLLDHIRPPSGMTLGKTRKVDYEYERRGSCNVFCAVEPLVGRYFNEVTPRRTKDDFAQFVIQIEKQYRSANKIVLVMDNLNTHGVNSLIKHMGEPKAQKLWNRFEVHYTPKHGSWLNQAEIAINIYARQCLGKSRIPSIEILRKKTKAWNTVINAKEVTINWAFTKEDARRKFGYG